MDFTNLYQLKIMSKIDKVFLRQLQLEECKTKNDRDVLLDRWTLEDGLEKIADAQSKNYRYRFLGIF